MGRNALGFAAASNGPTTIPPRYPSCSQEDIANRRSMADARSAERVFFESHPEYMEVAPQVIGSRDA